MTTQLWFLVGVIYGAGVVFCSPNVFVEDLKIYQRLLLLLFALVWPIALPVLALYDLYDDWKFERAMREIRRSSSGK